MADWSWVGAETIYCKGHWGISRGWGMVFFLLLKKWGIILFKMTEVMCMRYYTLIQKKIYRVTQREGYQGK